MADEVLPDKPAAPPPEPPITVNAPDGLWQYVAGVGMVHITDADGKPVVPVKPTAEPKTKVTEADADDAIGEHLTKLGADAIEVGKQEITRIADRLLGVAANSIRRIQEGDKKK